MYKFVLPHSQILCLHLLMANVLKTLVPSPTDLHKSFYFSKTVEDVIKMVTGPKDGSSHWAFTESRDCMNHSTWMLVLMDAERITGKDPEEHMTTPYSCNPQNRLQIRDSYRPLGTGSMGRELQGPGTHSVDKGEARALSE